MTPRLASQRVAGKFGLATGTDLIGSVPYFVMVSTPGVGRSLAEEDAFAEQFETGATVGLAFEHLEPVDVAFDDS